MNNTHLWYSWEWFIIGFTTLEVLTITTWAMSGYNWQMLVA